MNNTQIYAAITEKIIANLETAGSWKKLWQIPSPVSLNGHYYRGINRLILSSDPFKSRVFGTFQQIRANGVRCVKAKRPPSSFSGKCPSTRMKRPGNQKDVPTAVFPCFQYDQADFDEQGSCKESTKLQSLVEEKHNESHVDAEEIIMGYQDKPDIHFLGQRRPWPITLPMADMISIPKIKVFCQMLQNFTRKLWLP